jgi:GxxExxY protein
MNLSRSRSSALPSRFHRALGPGLLESAYEECLCHEFHLRGISFERQKPLAVEYQGVKLDCGYGLDVIAENKVVLEVKCVEHILPVHEAQLLTYLKMTGMRVGLILNFNAATLVRKRNCTKSSLGFLGASVSPW